MQHYEVYTQQDVACLPVCFFFFSLTTKPTIVSLSVCGSEQHYVISLEICLGFEGLFPFSQTGQTPHQI